MEKRALEPMEEASYNRKVIQLALDAGSTQLSNGAEIWRVDDTISHICRAYGITDVDAFILSNAIFITGNNEEEAVFAKVKHIPISGVHLGIITDVNDLSREISAGMWTVEEASEKLTEIRNQPPKNQIYRGVASGIASGCFGYILGADLIECFITVIVAFSVLMFAMYLEKHCVAKMVKNILGGGLIAVMALLVTYVPCFAGASVDKIIIGAIMPLIPGVAFVNSIRDLANSDFISGTVRMLDTIMVFMYIAIGAGMALSLYHGILGGAL